MQRDFTAEATELFTRFANRHGLSYDAPEPAPIEVLWEFPIQKKLIHPIILGLQNGDELNFGVGNFWSYIFPYPARSAFFEHLIDSWVEGRARVVPKRGLITQRQELQVLEGGIWQTSYVASSWRRGRTQGAPILSNTP